MSTHALRLIAVALVFVSGVVAWGQSSIGSLLDRNSPLFGGAAPVVSQSTAPSTSTSAAPIGDAAQNVVEAPSRFSIFEGYAGVFIASFLVTLFATPIMRRVAIKHGIIDRPSDPRKVHKIPVAYLGGIAVYLGLMAGVFFSLLGTRFPGLVDYHASKAANLIDSEFHLPVPMSVLLGLTIIVLVGVIDDMVGISPRVKIGGQLFAAAALAYETVGVRMAAGIVLPFCHALGLPITTIQTDMGPVETVAWMMPWVGGGTITIDFIYWISTGIIAMAVVALCNASNLIDGLDGLLSGTTAISGVGVLIIALGLALADDGKLDSQRIVLCLAVIGACMGFLPHNFNPATIFLGDAGSLLLGFAMCALILSLGDTGKTHLVAAGLICYMLPVLDTSLAIIRRKMEGKPISAADDQHLHHILKRRFGVKKAVLILYGMAGTFAMLGAMVSLGRARVVYLLALVAVAFIAVTAIKIARRRAIEAQILAREAGLAPAVPQPVQPEATPPQTGGMSGAPPAA
jgi:UDP-GlcNAc:undecaprenyl-phosphate GlcNAc-1-phosphate transferase